MDAPVRAFITMIPYHHTAERGNACEDEAAATADDVVATPRVRDDLIAKALSVRHCVRRHRVDGQPGMAAMREGR